MVPTYQAFSSNGFVLGLTAATSWGVADFFTRYATRLTGSYRTLLFVQLISFICLSIYLITTGTLQRVVSSTGWQPWVWALLTVMIQIVSALSLYHAFEVGSLAIVSPIAASYSAVTVLLAVISGEVVSALHGMGMGITMLGIVLASVPLVAETGQRTSSHMRYWSDKIPPGVTWAVVASVGYGFFFWLLGIHVTPLLGGIVPVWLGRLTGICLLPLVAPLLRQSVRFPQGRVWWYLVGVSVLDTIAFVATSIGFTVSQISLVSVLAALFSPITFMLAWIFLREPLSWSQWLGVCIIFVGIVLVNV